MASTFCSYFNQAQCRSCTQIAVPYAEQIVVKEQKIRNALAFMNPFVLEKPALSEEQGFRNRAKMTVTGTSENPIIGLTGALTGDASELDQGREQLACPIHHPKINEVIQKLPDFITRFNLIPYRITERRGELKGLILYYSPPTDQMYLRFVLRSKECVSRIRKLLPELQSIFPRLVCISANIQPIAHAILEGPEEIILTEKNHIDHQIAADGITLKLAPQAFVQTNSDVAAKLYETAARWMGDNYAAKTDSITDSKMGSNIDSNLDSESNEDSNMGSNINMNSSTRSVQDSHQPFKMLELYCGQGAFSFAAANRSTASPIQCLGVDVNAEGIRAANETSTLHGLKNIRFECADATQVEDKIRAAQPDLILVNPPRKGLGAGVAHLKSHPPKTLIYSSCSIESLAKDLKELAPLYKIKRAQLFDMFPHTEHFETLIELTRLV